MTGPGELGMTARRGQQVGVHLVGAGPGDPGLLTRRGAEVLAAADVVVHDRLVDRRVLELARPGAELVDVGKQPGGDAQAAQEAINALLVERARSGRRVVRLKGGDPYLLGRGGEEALALQQAGVGYEVVPGVSAALAAPALAGVPLTLRGQSSSVAVVSGHDPDSADWAGLAAFAGTLVVLMGAERRRDVTARLIELGRLPDTPVVVIERASTDRQRTVRTVLGELGKIEVVSPATIVVGTVAALGLASFESRPLFGRRVVVTRASEQAGALGAALAGLGATVVELATVAFAEPSDGGRALQGALAELGRFAWVVFTSANAVRFTFDRLRDARALAGPDVAAIGRATAAALAERGVKADLVPAVATSEGLLAAFPPPPEAGSRQVLIPGAAARREVLAAGLAVAGWQPEPVEAYRTVRPPVEGSSLRRLAGADAVTFASASAVQGFLSLVGAGSPVGAAGSLAGAAGLPPVVATIGPVTSAAARAAGIEVDVEAPEADVGALAAALAAHFTALRCDHA